MSILDWLRTAVSTTSAGPGETDTVRRIVKELDQLDPQRARYVAAFAYLLGRVAHADLEISDIETEAMIGLVRRAGHLPEAQAILVVDIAKHQNRLLGGTENFLVTREFRQCSLEEQRYELLACLFAVSAADGEIAADEEAEMRQIASELGIPHADYIKMRLQYSDKRTVFRDRVE